MIIAIQNTIGAIRNQSGAGQALLLDTYGSASVAYSLRLLNSSYSGNAINVRRASDDANQDIGFSSGVLDISSLESFCSGTDGFVTTWYDQSGNSNNATQSTASSQPKIVNSGSVITENGKASLSYDGSDDGLTIATPVNLNAEFFTPLVYKSTRSSSEDYVLYGDSGASRFRLYDYQTKIYIDNTTYTFSSSSNFGTQYLWNCEANTNNELIVYRNNSALGVSQDIPSDDDFIIGFVGDDPGSRNFTGFMQEVVLYAQDESTNRVGINTNINDYYSIY